MSGSPPITVVVPVYRNASDVQRCLHSIIHHAPGLDATFELLVIDDASPEPDVGVVLREFGSSPHSIPVTILRNDENLGFVGTMNRGLREARGDVVMLNADTEVTAGWLDSLASLAREPDVATVTPLTNHGSICTLPTSVIAAFGLDGAEPRIAECAEFVRSRTLDIRPEVITGVGFCMYTTRAALDRVGMLDEKTFGRGYGEEVDFCLRATRMGMRHLVDDSTFVFHRGGGSFGDEQKDRWASSAALLDDRYPYFRPTNQRERSEDPMRVPFTALDLALRERDTSREHVLHVLHSPPDSRGGTERFVEALVAACEKDLDFCIGFPVPNGFMILTHWQVPGIPETVRDEFLVPAGGRAVTEPSDSAAGAAFSMALDLFGFDAVHIHNLIGSSLAPLPALRNFAGPVICSVHDLFLACPNFSLLYKGAESCGIPSRRETCAQCLKEIASHPVPGSPQIPSLGLDYLDEFRGIVRSHLDVVQTWVFASRSAADTFLRVYEPDRGRMVVIEHGSVIPIGEERVKPNERVVYEEPLRVAFVGLGWLKKGLAAVNHAADALSSSPIEIHHFGEMKEPGSPNLVAHGSYENIELPDLLRAARIQVALLPGPYAETFGLAMTEIFAAGIPVIGTTYGALGERIRAHGTGWTVDPMDYEGIVSLIERLDACRDEVMRATRRVARLPLPTVADTAPRYRALYRNSTLSLS